MTCASAAKLIAAPILVLLVHLPGAAMGEASPSETAAAPAVAAVSHFAGTSPERCVYAAPGLQLCNWPLEGRLLGTEDPGKIPLALNLICELGIEAAPDDEPACAVHSLGPLADPLPPVGAAGPGVLQDLLERIAGATTATQISRRLGDIPTICRTSAAVQRCDWQSDGATLRCELPLDGTSRAADSCRLIEQVPDPS